MTASTAAGKGPAVGSFQWCSNQMKAYHAKTVHIQGRVVTVDGVEKPEEIPLGSLDWRIQLQYTSIRFSDTRAPDTNPLRNSRKLFQKLGAFVDERKPGTRGTLDTASSVGIIGGGALAGAVVVGGPTSLLLTPFIGVPFGAVVGVAGGYVAFRLLKPDVQRVVYGARMPVLIELIDAILFEKTGKHVNDLPELKAASSISTITEADITANFMRGVLPLDDKHPWLTPFITIRNPETGVISIHYACLDDGCWKTRPVTGKSGLNRLDEGLFQKFSDQIGAIPVS